MSESSARESTTNNALLQSLLGEALDARISIDVSNMQWKRVITSTSRWTVGCLIKWELVVSVLGLRFIVRHSDHLVSGSTEIAVSRYSGSRTIGLEWASCIAGVSIRRLDAA
jgi:hypothetical protein